MRLVQAKVPQDLSLVAALLLGIAETFAAVLILGWAVVTGSLRLLWNVLLLPIRLLESLAGRR